MNIIMFPGQGAQHLGMGRDLFKEHKRLIEKCNQILDYDLVSVCLEDDAELLNQTQYTQPLLYIVCSLSFMEYDGKTDAVMGHSLGLYPALFASGMIDFYDGLQIVCERARLMSLVSGGGMLAILGQKLDEIESILVSEGFDGIDVANDNAPLQKIVSGPKDDLNLVRPMLIEKGYHVVPLTVSGAFHSRYMSNASYDFFNYIKEFSFQKPKIPVISTTNGEYVSLSHLLEELTQQLVQPVRWRQTIQSLTAKYPQANFIEMGPGNVLTRLNQQII